MAVSDAQKVDLLYKKLFGVAKTDNSTNKSPSNESIASPAFLRGDTIWTQSTLIPNVAANVTGVVQGYTNAGAVQCTADTTSTPISSVYPTWKTNLTNWVPPEFGATYFVKVYAAAANVANVEATGTQLFAAGSGGTGEWYFDPVAGVLNFIGQTIPSALTTSNVIYVSGYRYIGTTGVASNLSGSFGNITISNNTIASTNTNGNINLTPDGSGIIVTTSNVSASYFIGNGSQLTGIVTYTNANVASYLPVYPGNVNAAYFIGNGATLTSVTGANVTGTVANATYAAQAGQANYANTATYVTGLTGTNVNVALGYVPLNSNATALTAQYVTQAAQSNITSLGNLTSLTVTGNAVITGNLTVSNVTYINQEIVSNTEIVAGNLTANGLVINTSGTFGTTLGVTNGITIGNGTLLSNVALQVNANTSILLPVGTDVQRPGTANAGMFRFSTTSGKVEWYTGSAWQAPITSYTQITSNAQIADGTNVTFPLPVANATTAGTIVSINGIVQQPVASYSITANNIVFTEAPLASDVVDIRIFSTTESVSSVSDVFGNTGVFFDQATSGEQITYFKNAGSISATFQPNGQMRMLGNIGSSSYTTGQLVVTGGVGVSGNVYINDHMFAVAKSFLIDHPSKPDYKLQYTCLEGPENGVYVRGRLNDGNIIELPDYWVNLVDEETITVDLTPVGEFQQLYVTKINNNKVFVKNTTGTTCNCFYTVWAERKDIEKLTVEYPK